MKKLTFLPLLLLISVLLPSCLKSELDDYDKWREKNEAYIRNVDKAEYKPYSPVWAPASTVYINGITTPVSRRRTFSRSPRRQCA